MHLTHHECFRFFLNYGYQSKKVWNYEQNRFVNETDFDKEMCDNVTVIASQYLEKEIDLSTVKVDLLQITPPHWIVRDI